MPKSRANYAPIYCIISFITAVPSQNAHEHATSEPLNPWDPPVSERLSTVAAL
jgi:hypothetical protein